MRDQPEQQAPPVQRLRIRYAKRGRMRFASHRDFSRAFERALVRAQVPMAYSSGFNPHPRISYAGAAPTGSASEAEYLEIGLAEEVGSGRVQAALAESLPPGLDVLEVVAGLPGKLADRLEASRWQIRVAASAAEAGPAVDAFLARDAVEVERMTKKGKRSFDCRAAVLALSVEDPDPAHDGAVLDLVLRHTEPAVRPGDVLQGLEAVGGLAVGPAPRLTRTQQGPLEPGSTRIGDPLADHG